MVCRLAGLAAVTLLLGARPLPGNAGAPAGRVTDLDQFTDAQLLADFRDELDDILQGHDPNENVDPEDLRDEVMYAIGNEGDEGDPEESEIDLEDLEAEMEEAGTCVEDVVSEIVGKAKEGCDGSARQGVELRSPGSGPSAEAVGGSWIPPRRDIPGRGAITFQRYVRARSQH